MEGTSKDIEVSKNEKEVEGGRPNVLSMPKYFGLFGDSPLFTSYLNTSLDNTNVFIKRIWFLFLQFLDTTGRNIGQVCFANNPISGYLILIGLCVGIPIVSLATLFASTVGVIFALVLNLSTRNLSAGLTCYNAALLGAVLPALLLGDDSNLSTNSVFLAVFVGAIITVVMTVSLANSLGSLQPSMPIFTIPFNLTGMLMIICLKVYQEPVQASSENDSNTVLQWEKVFQGGFLGAGQVFAVQDYACSGLVLFGMAVCSPLLALSGFLGSLIATCCGILVSPSIYDAAYAGIYGYNGFLAACAVCFFFVPSWRSLILAIVNSMLAAIIQVALAWSLSDAKLPVLTLPFVGASLLLLAFTTEDNALPRPQMLTFPEQHLFQWRRRRFSSDSTNSA